MSAGFEDQLRAFTERARQKAEDLVGSRPLTEAYSPQFMQRHTPYASLDAMLEASGVTVAEAFASPPPAEWEAHVREHTKFSSWEEMRQAANDAFLRRELTDG